MKRSLLFAAIVIVITAPVWAQNALDRYVGEYRIVGVPLTIVVTLENGKLMAQATAQPKVELSPVSGEEYAVVGAPIKMTFQRDAGGRVTGMTINQGGQDFAAPKAGADGSAAAASSLDKSPHKSAIVAANGIKMHYLDWGGSGEVILLLAGFGNDAHVFDTFAPRFTDKFRVVALTRRGFGDTERPPGRYDTATRVEDVRAFMDVMKIDKAHVVGHSLAGDELTELAIKYPARVARLVYLDAAYDRSNQNKCGNPEPPGGMPPVYKKLLAESLDCPGAAQIVVNDLPPPDMYSMMVATIRAANQFRPDYAKIAAPALAIYADADTPQPFGPMDEETAKKFSSYWKDTEAPRTRRSIDKFRREAKLGKVIEIKGAGHYVFQGDPANTTIAAMREFLIQK